MKGLEWNEIIKSPYPASSLNEDCCVFLGTEFLSERLWLERVVSLRLMTGVSWLTVRSKEHIECIVVVGRRLIGRSIGWLVVMLGLRMWKLNEHSLNVVNHS